MKKKAIRYLRFSKDGQSTSSIERQDMNTAQWCERNDVMIVDTFIDEGYSAQHFDRPDYKRLTEFIAKYHKMVDYLVVEQMQRFSRDTGEALITIKKLQKKYSIQISSAMEGIIFDYHTPGSFFRTGLQFLLAEDFNIDRMNKINGGIYTAKAREGRYVAGLPPYGYTKDGKGKQKHLVINEEQATIIRFIFSSFIKGVPIYIIRKQAKEKGYKVEGNSNVEKILTNPVYAGFLKVKANKDLPGGLFPGIHTPIIDMETWNQTQIKLRRPAQQRKILNDNYPLRGVLRCHCSVHLTGAASRGKSGKYFDYYKCHKKGHNNISAIKAHDQLQEILTLLSLPSYLVNAIREESGALMKEKLKENKKHLLVATQEKIRLDKQLHSVEEKWINNQLPSESYQRWYHDITSQRIRVSGDIEKYSRNEEESWWLLSQELEKLTDLRYLYNGISISDKQELIRQVFDDRLYYKDKLYRTPYIMETFTHNLFILKQKQLLILEGRDYTLDESPQKWRTGGANRTLPDLLSFISRLKVA